MTPAAVAAFAGGYALAARRRRRRHETVRPAGTRTLRGLPDSRRQPSDGVVVEAAVVARLLRLRLLTLDATVVVSPAVVTARGAAAAPPRFERDGAGAALAADGAGRSHAASPPAASAGPVGRRLAQAARTLDESAATLAATRR